MARVENNEPHAFEHAAPNPRDDFIRNLPVRYMPPPHEDIRALQHAFGESVLGLIQPCGAHGKIRLRTQKIRNRLVHAARIDLRDFRIGFFVTKFIPNEDFQGVLHNIFPMDDDWG